MLDFILWYIVVSIAGILIYPYLFRLLPGLKDRGYSFARTLALLVWGYVFWLLTSLRITVNQPGGILLALLLVTAGGILYLKPSGLIELKEWVKQNRSQIINTELVFLFMFVFWAVIRATDPRIIATEKPMELAFINSILRSPTFPPNDPWLSGYGISYYYFGYVIVGMLLKMTGISSSVGFNLAVACWFGLVAQSAYGVLYNLLSNRWISSKKIKLNISQAAILAPLFILLLGNFEGALEVIYARGWFTRSTPAGVVSAPIWEWMNIQEICNPTAPPYSWLPDRYGGSWWWWRGSRVLQDFDMTQYHQIAAGAKCLKGIEIIDEIPIFSYILADLHPHVLTMPFVLLIMGVCLNLFLSNQTKLLNGPGFIQWLRHWLFGRDKPIGIPAFIQWSGGWNILLVILICGSLGFTNTWDFPIYIVLLAGLYTFQRWKANGWSAHRVWDFLETCIFAGILGGILYLPFYLSFSSQAGGLLPSMGFFTRNVYLWVFFGPLFIPIFAWLIWKVRLKQIQLKPGIRVALWVIGSFWLLSYLLGIFIANLQSLGNLWMMSAIPGSSVSRLAEKMILAGSTFFGIQGSGSFNDLIFGSLLRRVSAPGTILTLGALIALVWASIRHFLTLQPQPNDTNEADAQNHESQIKPADVFTLTLILLGLGLIIFPEFFYLRDQFGNRMNTIFKFYFQAWILLAVSMGYAVYELWGALTGIWKALLRIGLCITIALGMVYPFLSIAWKFDNIQNERLSLDGTAYLKEYSPAEYGAIQWLSKAPMGVVAEAVGGSYRPEFARISTHTGLPTVLGWPGHESQWRGGAAEMGNREQDINRLYRTNDWEEARNILIQYNIRYIYVGGSERSTYRVNENKFRANLKPVFEQDEVVIFEFSTADTTKP
jgi:YYY domain-containing protein